MPTSQLNKPVIAITMGDPAGIGPEVIIKALYKKQYDLKASFLIIGDCKVIEKIRKKLNFKLAYNKITKIEDFKEDQKINILDLNNVKNGLKSRLQCGKASLEYIDKFLDLYKKKSVSSLVTGPVSKESIKLFKKSFIGHTEYLAGKTASKNFAMMFAGGPFNVVLLTTHIPLKDVARQISKQKIVDKIKLIYEFYQKYYNNLRPAIGITALNPHCGEGGSLGKEEKNVIKPACEYLQKKKLKVLGPFSTEAIFFDAYNRKKYDIILCMYHDQALTPLKMIARDRLVNITIGLPFLRTSPAHGVGFDIKDKLIADSGSMENAIEMAVNPVRNNEKNRS